ncbi:MAG: hypothetical protein PVG72_04320 [Gammaproteobacteria bacterium]|jgi:hypothetical protein
MSISTTPNRSFSDQQNSTYQPAIQLLSALWRSRDRVHQLGIHDRQTGRFKHIPVNDIAEAISLAHKHSSERVEVYFACAEYQSSISWTVANVYGAYGFWLDIDCGEDKAAAGKGYPTPEAAEVALLQFYNDTGLPRPTTSFTAAAASMLIGHSTVWLFATNGCPTPGNSRP